MTELVGIAAKVLLTGAIVFVISVLAWQAIRIWTSHTLVLAPFDFLEAGKPSPESGEQFARMIRADLIQLAGLYGAGEVSNPSAVPSAGRASSAEPMEIPDEFATTFFDDVELKAYGIEFGSVFKALRRQMESSSDITGSVTHQGDQYSVFVELNLPGQGRKSPQQWNIPYASTVPEATRDTACRIFRFLAADTKGSKEASLFHQVDDEDFCLFNRALAAYDEYRLRKAVLSQEDATKLLAAADGPLKNLLGRPSVTFPYVYKLAALVSFEQEKYVEAESAIDQYTAWLARSHRNDPAAAPLKKNIGAKKLQTTPAVSKLRPLQAGGSVGLLADKRAGMICCFAKDAAGRRYIVSAVTVLGTTAGAKVVQPAAHDGGGEEEVVAEVAQATSTFTVARIRDDIGVDPRVLQLGAIKGFESAPPDGQVVIAYGFDGTRKEGQVVSKPPSLEVESGDKQSKISLKNVIITSEISSGGEIGAPVMTPDGKLVGMIFGSGGKTTVVVPVEPELKALGLELVK